MVVRNDSQTPFQQGVGRHSFSAVVSSVLPVTLFSTICISVCKLSPDRDQKERGINRAKVYQGLQGGMGH